LDAKHGKACQGVVGSNPLKMDLNRLGIENFIFV
jgi:hypothetical protein